VPLCQRMTNSSMFSYKLACRQTSDIITIAIFFFSVGIIDDACPSLKAETDNFEVIVLIIWFKWLFELFSYIIIIVFYGFLISLLPPPAIGLVYSCKSTYYKEQQYLNGQRQTDNLLI